MAAMTAVTAACWASSTAWMLRRAATSAASAAFCCFSRSPASTRLEARVKAMSADGRGRASRSFSRSFSTRAAAWRGASEVNARIAISS